MPKTIKYEDFEKFIDALDDSIKRIDNDSKANKKEESVYYSALVNLKMAKRLACLFMDYPRYNKIIQEEKRGHIKADKK